MTFFDHSLETLPQDLESNNPSLKRKNAAQLHLDFSDMKRSRNISINADQDNKDDSEAWKNLKNSDFLKNDKERRKEEKNKRFKSAVNKIRTVNRIMSLSQNVDEVNE